MYILEDEILADFNLAVGRPTTKPPNLNHRQIFRPYDMLKLHSSVGNNDEPSFE